jgi:hypothetical protein
MTMVFYAEQVVYSLEENWDELVNITFVNSQDYISITALTYEDQIDMEVNDQINSITILKDNFEYYLLETSLHIQWKAGAVRSNLPNSKFAIHFPPPHQEKLTNALYALTNNPEE